MQTPVCERILTDTISYTEYRMQLTEIVCTSPCLGYRLVEPQICLVTNSLYVSPKLLCYLVSTLEIPLFRPKKGAGQLLLTNLLTYLQRRLGY